MADNSNLARTLQRIAITLGVPVADLYGKDAAPTVDAALPVAVANFLEAFTRIADTTERQRCIDLLNAETERLRGKSLGKASGQA